MITTPGKSIRLSIFSVPAHLPVVRAAVERACREVGFDEEVTGSVVLSVDEALANIIRHAYRGADDQKIEIELVPLGSQNVEGLRISLRDYGRHVDPSKIKSRDLQDVRPGGLGVHIIKKCMDSVQFEPADGGGTLLTMVKRLNAPQEANK